MRSLIFAANWKMHLGPVGARRFLSAFFEEYEMMADREVWLFPPAVSLEAVATQVRDRPDIRVGAQNVFWEPKGAFTGELSLEMIKESGADLALVGHSERRHVFGETDEEAEKKVSALLDGGVTPLLCVGEKIEEREVGDTLTVVERQLSALSSLEAEELARVVVAYEPVWAIGTGRTATPADAAEVHAAIRTWLTGHGVKKDGIRILYGGSVKPANAPSLVAEPEIDGVLVGGASLDPENWAAITQATVD